MHEITLWLTIDKEREEWQVFRHSITEKHIKNQLIGQSHELVKGGKF